MHYLCFFLKILFPFMLPLGLALTVTYTKKWVELSLARRGLKYLSIWIFAVTIIVVFLMIAFDLPLKSVVLE